MENSRHGLRETTRRLSWSAAPPNFSAYGVKFSWLTFCCCACVCLSVCVRVSVRRFYQYTLGLCASNVDMMVSSVCARHSKNLAVDQRSDRNGCLLADK